MVKESACNAGDVGSIPGLGRSPTPVFLLGESPWIEEPGGHKESDMTEQLSRAHAKHSHSEHLLLLQDPPSVHFHSFCQVSLPAHHVARVSLLGVLSPV